MLISVAAKEERARLAEKLARGRPQSETITAAPAKCLKNLNRGSLYDA